MKLNNNQRLVIICLFILAALLLGVSFEQIMNLIPLLLGS